MKITIWKYVMAASAALLIRAGTARGATCSVPSDHPTIQSAVDDATCSIVNVAPGLYPENVFISRAVTLNGAQAGQATAGRTSGGPNESIVVGVAPTGDHAVFVINGPSVTIDGFTVANAVTSGAAIGIQIKPSTDSVVLNNFIDGITTGAPGAKAIGVHMQNGLFDVNVSHNNIRNVVSPGPATGVQFGDNDDVVGINIALLDNNTISGVTSTSAGASAVICLKCLLQPTGFYFQNNHVSNISGAAYAHAVDLQTDLWVPLVQSNDFTGLTSASGDVAAIFLDNNPKMYSANCTGNFFNVPAPGYAIKCQGPFDSNYPPPMIASCCWWNSPDGPGPVGPGHGSLVSPNVRYSPWRVTPTPENSACVGSNIPIVEGDCKTGGWITHVRPDGSSFKSQGDCIQFLNNGK
ncbi:MAG TPA: hypothetical protein VGW57_09865 [Chthoniobacterales bacterium]|nr:hypothetical protein [Chthoniobacterales bacterium]